MFGLFTSANKQTNKQTNKQKQKISHQRLEQQQQQQQQQQRYLQGAGEDKKIYSLYQEEEQRNKNNMHNYVLQSIPKRLSYPDIWIGK